MLIVMERTIWYTSKF